MKTRTSPRWSAGASALIGLVLLAGSAARAQEAATEADMKAYTEAVPGTSVKIDLVPIPGGTFTMGSPDDEADRSEHEGPQHEVKVGPFWMGKFEITWEQFDEFAFSNDLKRKDREKVDRNAQPETEKKADAVSRPTPPYADETFGFGRNGKPAISMTHHSAMEFTRWLSEKTGHTYRLPTEAEWEYAARAGTKTAFWFGDAPDDMKANEWYFENSEGPQKVGTKKPNPWGLHDMLGNVSEWTLDHYVEDLYSTRSADAPTVRPVVVPDEKEYPYVARGGSWDMDAFDCRSAARHVSDVEWSVQDPNRPQSIWWHTDATFVGFRIVRPLEEQADLVGVRSKVVKGKSTR